MYNACKVHCVNEHVSYMINIKYYQLQLLSYLRLFMPNQPRLITAIYGMVMMAHIWQSPTLNVCYNKRTIKMNSLPLILLSQPFIHEIFFLYKRAARRKERLRRPSIKVLPACMKSRSRKELQYYVSGGENMCDNRTYIANNVRKTNWKERVNEIIYNM